jgi:dTDP-4-amino-4,6-dideoxygalactose transaminase
VKLRHLDRWNEARRTAASWYRQELEGAPGVELLPVSPWTGKHSYHLLVARIMSRPRDVVAKDLAARGVQTVVHYPVPVHLQPAYGDLGLPKGSFPTAERLAGEILSLPMFPEIRRDEVAYVAESLRACCG